MVMIVVFVYCVCQYGKKRGKRGRERERLIKPLDTAPSRRRNAKGETKYDHRTFHCHALSNISARGGGTNALLSKVTKGGPVDGVGGSSADGGKGDDCGDLHFQELQQEKYNAISAKRVERNTMQAIFDCGSTVGIVW